MLKYMPVLLSSQLGDHTHNVSMPLVLLNKCERHKKKLKRRICKVPLLVSVVAITIHNTQNFFFQGGVQNTQNEHDAGEQLLHSVMHERPQTTYKHTSTQRCALSSLFRLLVSERVLHLNVEDITAKGSGFHYLSTLALLHHIPISK